MFKFFLSNLITLIDVLFMLFQSIGILVFFLNSVKYSPHRSWMFLYSLI